MINDTTAKFKGVVKKNEDEVAKLIEETTAKFKGVVKKNEDEVAKLIEEKDNEIKVSSHQINLWILIVPLLTHNNPTYQVLVEANEKRKRKDAKIHKKEQVTKDKKYSQLIKTSVAKHSKIISGLRLDVHQSEVKVNVATVRYQSLKRAYNAILDASKIKHRASLRKQQVLHAQHIQKKKWNAKEDVGRRQRDLWDVVWNVGGDEWVKTVCEGCINISR